MAGTIVADQLEAASTSTLVIKNGVANTPPTIQDSAGTQIGTFCRAFVNFNGTTNVGGFCTIRASFNVTSVADNGTADYTVNFTTAMTDANYAAVGITGSTAGGAAQMLVPGGAQTTSACRVVAYVWNASQIDSSYVSVAIFR
jgi:hypothetical protein